MRYILPSLRAALCALGVLGGELRAQQPRTVQAATAAATRDQITADLKFGTGRTQSFLAGSTLSLAGVVTGTPTGGTLNLSNVTLNIGAASGTSLSTTRQAHGDMGAGNETFDLSAAEMHTGTLSANITPILTGWAASGKRSVMAIRFAQNGTGGWTVTWPAEVVDSANILIALGPNAATRILLETDDGGANVYWASSAATEVAQTITNGVTTTAPSQDTVFDALALKASLTGAETLTSKRINARITSISSSATPTINTDNCDVVTITALAAAITSMTTNLSGTPVNFDQLEIRILDDGTARAITWGASFASGPATLPTTTVLGKALTVYLEWDSVQAKWMCHFAASYP